MKALFLIARFTIIISVLLFTDECLHAQSSVPDTVTIQSDNLRLKGLLWEPGGTGSFPAIIFCHGSYGGADTIHDPLQQTSLLGPVFVRRGYIFLSLFRRGVGLSKGQGINSAELMNNAFKEKGQEERNTVQLQQLETDQLQDMISGVKFLKNLRNTDTSRLAIIGHSFGGSLALLLAEHERNVKAVVIFSPGGYSWDLSALLRKRLLATIKNIAMPVMIIHAQNDYSTNPGYVMDSIMNRLHKPHVLKIYPKFGSSANDGHNLIFLSIKTWEKDVFRFLNGNLH